MQRTHARIALGCGLLMVTGWATWAAGQAQVTGTGELLPAQADGASWVVGGQLVVGDTGAGSVFAQGSGDVHSAGLIAGRQASGDGMLTFSGVGTTLDTTGDLVLGEAGVGRFRLFDHARVVTGPAADVRLGGATGGRGELEINAFGKLDVGRHLTVDGYVDEQGIASVALDGGARLRVGTENAGGDLRLNEIGHTEVTLTAAGAATLVDVADVWRIGGGGAATVELLDGATGVAARVELGVASHGRLTVDDALLTTEVLSAALQSDGRATVEIRSAGRVQVGGGGVSLGEGRATVEIAGVLNSAGRIDLSGTTHTPAHRVEVSGAEAALTTATWLGVGGPTADRRARLELRGGTATAGTFAVVEAGGTLSGAGTLALGDRLTVRGAVETSGGVLRVEAPNASRFQNGELDARFAVVEVDHDDESLTPPLIEVAHGVLRFTSDARLDGRLVLTRTDGRLDLEVPMYEPWTLVDTADDNAALIGTFDLVSGLRQDLNTGLAVTYRTHAVEAQRAVLGDANLDGMIDQTDLDAVLHHWGDTSAHWALGDFNGDGAVRQSDLDAVLQQWGGLPGPSLAHTVVPEPATGVALLIPVGLARLRVGRGGCRCAAGGRG